MGCAWSLTGWMAVIFTRVGKAMGRLGSRQPSGGGEGFQVAAAAGQRESDLGEGHEIESHHSARPV